MAKLEKLNSLIPLYDLEQSAQQQIYNALELDFLIKLAIMPDCHTGYTLPIGGVALLDGVISPEYVGYDIGCGMCCVISNVHADIIFTQWRKESIFNEIYDKVPIGLGIEQIEPIPYIPFRSASEDKKLNKEVNKKVDVQLGTLGSGNHFIEIGMDKNGRATVTIHSGSRKIGHLIATHYMRLAKNEQKQLPNGFLDIESDLGQAYFHDMYYAQSYALENRSVMMKNVLSIIGFGKTEIRELMDKMINENHNHAMLRKDGVLHRKGATPADVGQLGVIPGTMKSGVYVTIGLGNEDYLSSSSHGAGRKFSRKKAKESITLERHKENMKGIVAKVDKSTIDESHDAYKNVKRVVEAQEGVVCETINILKPLINVKG